jgi:hypothetical protein
MEAKLSESGSMADSPGLKHGSKAIIIRQHGRKSRLKHGVKAFIIRQHGRKSRAKTRKQGCHNQAAWQKVQG